MSHAAFIETNLSNKVYPTRPSAKFFLKKANRYPKPAKYNLLAESYVDAEAAMYHYAWWFAHFEYFNSFHKYSELLVLI